MEKLTTEQGISYDHIRGSLYRNSKKLTFLCSGQEGSVFKDQDTAVKVYHSHPSKHTIKRTEINILKEISTNRIILPYEGLYLDPKVRGYTMPYIDGNADGIFSYSKEQLIEELKLLRQDLILLGKNHILVDDLRDSNYLCHKNEFYLIDCGDYQITSDDSTYENLKRFQEFFIQDILGAKLFEKYPNSAQAWKLFLQLRKKS